MKLGKSHRSTIQDLVDVVRGWNILSEKYSGKRDWEQHCWDGKTFSSKIPSMSLPEDRVKWWATLGSQWHHFVSLLRDFALI